MPLHDPTPERVSACPVHFLWDGRGRGRGLVRAGFLGFLAAALLALPAKMLHVPALTTVALVVVAGAAAAYALGQALSYVRAR